MVATAVQAPAVVPRLWPGATIVVLATGPSLCQADVDAVRGRAKVIAIKDAIDLAPWADVVYGCGQDRSRWWHRRGDSLSAFEGLRYTLDPAASKWATVLCNAGETGLELDPSGLRVGRNSGYQAINLAVHFGAARILLLGFDMKADPVQGNHFFGEHPTGNVPPYAHFLPRFATLVEPLRELGVAVVNCTPGSSLTTFPQMTLAEALP